jgi:hypothetical protein
MIGKLMLLPFRLLGSISGLGFGILKLIFSLLFGVLRLLFKNYIGLLVGLITGIYLVKKQMDKDCCCEDQKKEVPIE